MTDKEVKDRMVALEAYLNELSVNKLALSSKYFVKFLGLSLKVFFFIIIAIQR